MTARWSTNDIPDQRGRLAVVTGGTSGLGLETARMLAAHGATVVVAARDATRAEAAVRELETTTPVGTVVETLALDLASLASVRDAAAELAERHPRVDLLINNAGVMRPPFGRTADGFELQIGTNHLGHFALTALVLPSMLEVDGSRVVTVSSFVHQQGSIDLGDLHSTRRYRAGAAYAQSKLANLMFALELDRRLTAAGARTISVAAHPGFARTELARHLPAPARLAVGALPLVTHSATAGALSVARAATDPDVRGSEYYGPGGWRGLTGYPVLSGPSRDALDEDVQARLWQESERLTSCTFAL